MELQEISWPVYRLGRTNPELIDGVWMVVKEYIIAETGETIFKYRIIDDKSVEGDTLGVRRLNMVADGVRLFPIRRATYFLVDVIRGSLPEHWFVDNSGKVFKYTKKAVVPLVCKEIVKIMPNTNNIGSIIEVKGLSQRFKIAESKIHQQYAGLLVWGRGHLLYNLYDEPFKKTTRYV